MSLAGKTALITGSTSGIGLEIAHSLSKAGCRLMLHGIATSELVEQVSNDMRSSGAPDVFFNGADLSQSPQTISLINDAIEKLGTIDILVNNAGVQHVAPVDSFSDAHWDNIIEINLSAPFRLIRAALPIMRENEFGRIINIASVHGLVASEHKAAYIAAKHGLIGLTKTVALETATQTVTCNAISPGFVRTQLIESQIVSKAQKLDISINAAAAMILQDKQPSLEFVEPTDIASLAVFLCSDAAKQITGSTFTMDGGWTAQ